MHLAVFGWVMCALVCWCASITFTLDLVSDLEAEKPKFITTALYLVSEGGFSVCNRVNLINTYERADGVIGVKGKPKLISSSDDAGLVELKLKVGEQYTLNTLCWNAQTTLLVSSERFEVLSDGLIIILEKVDYTQGWKRQIIKGQDY